MIKKKLRLLLFAVMLLSVTCGCYRTKNEMKNYKSMDTDKAAEVALEYMNNKYYKEFHVISSTKDAKYSFAPGVVQDYWCDVELTIKDSEPNETYKVRVIHDSNKKDYIIEEDNYMTSLVKPWVKEQMDGILSQLDIHEYFTFLWSVDERITSGFGFSPEFKCINENNTLKEITDVYDVSLDYTIVIPSSSYNELLYYKIEKIYKEYFSQDFNGDYSGDCVDITIYTYTDDFYYKYKKAVVEGNQGNNELENRNRYQERLYTIYLN